MGILPAFYREVRLHEVTFPRSQGEWGCPDSDQVARMQTKACTPITLPTSLTFPEDQPVPEC